MTNITLFSTASNATALNSDLLYTTSQVYGSTCPFAVNTTGWGLVGTSTGVTPPAFAFAGSAPSPSGYGFLANSGFQTVLVPNQIYTVSPTAATLVVGVTGCNVVADIYLRFWRYDSATSTFSAFAEFKSPGVSMSDGVPVTLNVWETISNTALYFGANSGMFVDVVADVTSNTATSGGSDITMGSGGGLMLTFTTSYTAPGAQVFASPIVPDTATSIIKSALRKINSYQSGEQIAAPDFGDCLEALNDMLDMWSNDHVTIVGQQEYVFNWPMGSHLTNGIAQYKFGNPLCTDLGEPGMICSLNPGSNSISIVSGGLPPDLNVGAILSDAGGGIPEGTTVLSINTPSIGNITMSNNCISQAPIAADIVYYTIPGDIPFPRPLRITNGFTRINNLDFWMEVTASRDRFLEILYKAQPGPWPVTAWYNPTFPYGILNVYMVPGEQAEAHLYCDTMFSHMIATTPLVLPPGYAMAIKWNLAMQICQEYGFPMTEALKKNAKDSYDAIKRLNAEPAVVAKYDRALVRGNRIDGGWILHGGYLNQ